MSINRVLDDLQPPLQDHEREMVAKLRKQGSPEWSITGAITFGRIFEKAILKRVTIFLKEKSRTSYSNFGPSVIRFRVTDDGKATLFTLPNGVQVIVPDEVLSDKQSKFEPNPPTTTACYRWLSRVVVRSRIGHENLGEGR